MILKPTYYVGYVDDIFAMFSFRSESRQFFHLLNQLHHTINFLVNLKTNNSFSFLNILVRHSDSCFLISIYRKPTFTGLDSLCPKK